MPVILIQQGVHFFIATEIPEAADEQFVFQFRMMSLAFSVVGIGGYFVGKGLDERKEWARNVFVMACWIFVAGSLLVLIPKIMFFMSMPPIILFFGGLILTMKVAIPSYLAVRFSRADIRHQFVGKIEDENQPRSRKRADIATEAEQMFVQGNGRAKIEDYASAIDFYDRALALVPSHKKALRNRGIAHLMIGNRQQANDDFQLAYSLGLRTERLKKMIQSTA